MSFSKQVDGPSRKRALKKKGQVEDGMDGSFKDIFDLFEEVPPIQVFGLRNKIDVVNPNIVGNLMMV